VNYFYLAEDQKPVGPLPFSALQTLAASGVIKPDTLVIQEGGAEWKRWRDLELLGGRPGPSVPGSWSRLCERLDASPEQAVFVRFVDRCLDRTRQGADDRFAAAFQRYAQRVTNLGSYGVLLAGALIFLGSLVVAVRLDAGLPLAFGLAAALSSVILHYLAVRFTSANERLLDRSPVLLPTDVVPRTVGLIYLIAGVAILVLSLHSAMRSYVHISLRLSLTEAVAGLLAAALCGHVQIVCSLSKRLLNVACQEDGVVRAGDYYASLVKFSARLLLRMGSLLFGYGMIGALVALILSGLFLLGQSQAEAVEDAFTAALVALGLALVPMVIHFLYLGSVLAADLIGAIFAIERHTAPPAPAPQPKPD
jgi:hypothetical protein